MYGGGAGTSVSDVDAKPRSELVGLGLNIHRPLSRSIFSRTSLHQLTLPARWFLSISSCDELSSEQCAELPRPNLRNCSAAFVFAEFVPSLPRTVLPPQNFGESTVFFQESKTENRFYRESRKEARFRYSH